MIGVWGRAALLIGLFAAFLAARTTFEDEKAPAPRQRSNFARSSRVEVLGRISREI
jgi:hypothetical protein